MKRRCNSGDMSDDCQTLLYLSEESHESTSLDTTHDDEEGAARKVGKIGSFKEPNSEGSICRYPTLKHGRKQDLSL